MGTRTPNMSIYRPSPGETVYSQSFTAGLNNIDSHNHTGGPNNGVQIPTGGIEDGAITPAKLSQEIIVEATVQTTDATPTEIASIAIDDSQGITISGRVVGLRDDATECCGGEFSGTFHRPNSSSIQTVGIPKVIFDSNFSGVTNFQLVSDTVNEAISLRCVGESGKTIDWHVVYNTVDQPEN
jgi:hypothetical protein